MGPRLRGDDDGEVRGTCDCNDRCLARRGAGQLQLGTTAQTARLFLYGATAFDNNLSTLVTTDTQARFNLATNGGLSWGGGAATADTNLYRSAADRLKTDDLFDATTLALATKVKAGVPVDADWTAAPPDGTVVVDSTNSKIMVTA